MKKIVISAIALVIASAAPSFAQTHRDDVREGNQNYRIYRGAVQGELTPGELRNLDRQQNRIDRAQSRAARDGYVTRREQRKIENMQDRASRNIYRKTHNGRILY